ncbi:meiotic recombination protein REC114 [Echeneis naucrates]|uniref:meiotic recombination protein REC114 n=1 Tax=Echeneis naucrates TaxID=173247 RepID=UPI001113B591|nr:meiotic recombination protein REC114 [Echeneis naucrates]
MATNREWKLKRYGRFIPPAEENGKTAGNPWKIFEARKGKPEIILKIMETGDLLLLQGKEGLDTIPLLCGSDSLKVQQQSDTLMLKCTLNGESRMMRMQFDGNTRAEAIKKCSSAVEKLMVYLPVPTQDDAPLAHNQPPTEVSAPVIQGKAVGVEPEDVQASLSIKHLAQRFLGQAALTLPQVYRHDSLAQVDLEPILRVCLLDPSFPAFVEKVEGELMKLLQE